MGGKSTRQVWVAAVGASGLLHVLLLGGTILLDGRSQAPVPRGTQVPLRVLDARPRATTSLGDSPEGLPAPLGEVLAREGPSQAQETRSLRRKSPGAARRIVRAVARPENPRADEGASHGEDALLSPSGLDKAWGESGLPVQGLPAPSSEGIRGDAPEKTASPREDPLLAKRREYALAVRRAIAAVRTYPPGARRARAEGEVVIRVRIGASGLVDSVEVEESSGHKDLDRAAVRFAWSAPRLPPPPGGPMWVRIPIEFSLQ